MKRLTLYEAAYAIKILPEILDYDEPVGDLTKSALHKIQSCLDSPFIRHGRSFKYWFLYQRAAALFYFMIKSHALTNGNKRSAVIVTMAFLIKNDKWLNMNPDRLYDLALIVAKSPARDSDLVIDSLSKVFRATLRSF